MGRGIRWKRRRTLSSLPLRETSKLQLQIQQALLRTTCRPAEQFSHTQGCRERRVRGLAEGTDDALRTRTTRRACQRGGDVQAQGSSLESEGCEPHTRRLSAGIQCQNVSAFSWLEDQQGLSEGWKRLQLHPWREHAQVCLRSVPARRQQTETARCSAGPTPAYPSLCAGFLLQPGLFLHRFSLERKPPLPTRVHIHGGN